jgi:adenylate cyclase
VKKHLVRIALGLLVVLAFLGHAAKYYEIPFVARLEAIVYDARLQLTMPRTIDPRIVIVDIDERSLGLEGRWPWRRDRLGLLLDRLFDEYRVSIVGFDVVFAERDESSGLNVLRGLSENRLRGVPGFRTALDEIAPELEYDRIFAAKMRGRPVVLGYYFNRDPEEISSRVGQLPEPPEGCSRAVTLSPLAGPVTAPIWSSCRRPRRGPGTSTPGRTRTASPGACPCSPSAAGRITNRCRWRCCGSPWARLR